MTFVRRKERAEEGEEGMAWVLVNMLRQFLGNENL
jgi:hypothetical protein